MGHVWSDVCVSGAPPPGPRSKIVRMAPPPEPTIRSARVLPPRITIPGLVIEDLWLAPNAAVVAALTGPDSTGASSLLFLSTATGHEHGAVRVGSEELAVLAANWSIGASHHWLAGGITIWRPVTGEVIGRLNPHRDLGVHAVALADRGDLAASIGEDLRVALWRPRDGVVAAGFETISLLDLETCTLTFSPGGRLLAVRTDAYTVELWSTAPLQFLDTLPETGDPVFSPDGRWAAAAGDGIAIYDVRTGAPPATLPGRGPLAFTPDGALLVAAAPDGSTAVWRTDPTQPFGHLLGGTPRALSPDGQVLAMTGPGTALTLVDLATGKATAQLTGHRGGVHALAVGPAGGVTVAACSDATLRVWSALTA